jgi:hypothetical protein
LVLKRETRDRLDRLKVSTPTRAESYQDVILRILDNIEGVNTHDKQPNPKPEGVDTHKKSVNTFKPKSRKDLSAMSLEEAVELKLAGKI